LLKKKIKTGKTMTDALISRANSRYWLVFTASSLWQGLAGHIIRNITRDPTHVQLPNPYLIIALFLAYLLPPCPYYYTAVSKAVVYNLETAPDIVFLTAIKVQYATVRKHPLTQINVVTDIHNRFITYFNRHLPYWLHFG
jgi:hypothetical protein